MRNIIGDRIDDYIDSVGATTQAVVYGIGLTALAQAILAGMGYAFTNAPNPILLTLITFVVALYPLWYALCMGRCGGVVIIAGHTTRRHWTWLMGNF